MHRFYGGGENALIGYWNFDNACEETVFSCNKHAHSPEPLGRPSLLRSSIPVPANTQDCRLVQGPDGMDAVQLLPFRYLHCARNPLPQHCDATFEFRYLHEEHDTLVLFSFVNNQHCYIQLEPNRRFVFDSDSALPPGQPGWNTCVLRVRRDRVVDYFVNGALVFSMRQPPQLVDWHVRFDGMQLGWFDDKYNVFTACYIDSQRPKLMPQRTFADLRIWNRCLTDTEVASLSNPSAPLPRDPVCDWQLQSPDVNRNFYDRIQKLPMHIRAVRGWE